MTDAYLFSVPSATLPEDTKISQAGDLKMMQLSPGVIKV